MGPRRHRVRKGQRFAVIGGVILLLAGCNTLPDSGPTEAQFNHAQRDQKKNTLGYGIVEVTPELIALLDGEAPPAFSSLDKDNAPTTHTSNDTVGPGDLLQVAIYEVGSALFSPSSTAMAASSASGTSTQPSPSTASSLPLLSVDGSGDVDVPFAGQIHVTGMTTDQVAEAIQGRLKEKSQSPQVLVRIASDIANSVMVYGGVRRPSRVPLTPNRERILDVIALAGGQERLTQPDEDYVVRLTRNNRIAEMPLKAIENDPSQNILMQPGDRVQLTFTPRSFTVFGASGQVTQTQFTLPTLTMAQAISRVGGPIDSRSDPNAVYLFRFENADILHRLGMPIDDSAPTAPVVYKLDMMNPSNYFLAQKFMMRDRDLIYVANSSSNKFYKFFGLISTIIAPGITAAWIAK
ncbi:polysaccharide biosynthesis/export family protein [Komagataeibacter sp. FXV3]|uniref:polysaccharide biosynthesis/export family protein n=1 Tax=Komagataeibacter sp. FXV3 TaxID=2608998 RepID=UPI001D1237BC|nr:polysaccharide biosynthesis/export family protein [Komagataeibacter sp. FXV3]MBE7730097.1 polysaccharide export protein [Komagataeibacter sp. FXV3]